MGCPAKMLRLLARLAEWCCRYTPWSALDRAEGTIGGAAGLLLDVTGCAHLFGGEAALVSDLLAHLGRFGLTAQAGVADTLGAAWAVARFACREHPGATLVYRAPETVSGRPWRPCRRLTLRLSPASVELLDRLGIDRIAHGSMICRQRLCSRASESELARRLNQALGAKRRSRSRRSSRCRPMWPVGSSPSRS